MTSRYLCDLEADLEEVVIVEPSLLSDVDWTLPVPRRYDLGMSEFVDGSAFCKEADTDAPKPKGKENRKLSLSLNRKNKSRVSSAPPPKRARALQPICDNEANTADSSSRFDFSKRECYDDMAVKFVPENTRKNNGWAYNNFQAWREKRNREFPSEQCPSDLIESPPWDCAAISFWLSRYACETRNQTGNKYPPKTIFSLLSALLRQMRASDADCPIF